MKSKQVGKDKVIDDKTVGGPDTVHSTQQIKITDENAAKYATAFIIKIYGRLGYIIKLLEAEKAKKEDHGNPRVL